MRRSFGLIVAFLLVLPLMAHSVMAVAPGNDAFQRTWARADQPVAGGQANRTWMWGPEAFTEVMEEEYAEAPEGNRTVQYFDKSRMEITNPNGDSSSIWYVTNGLLVVELMTGQLQVGNDEFVPRLPAQVNVAGDSDDESGPTYATFSTLREGDALAEGDLITQRVSRDGTVTDDPSLATRDVRASRYVAQTGHSVAAPFWEFMNSSGPVFEGGSVVTAGLFENPFYATGFPVVEAYWAEVKVAGTPKDVLMQCFERRCLTYTPDNPPGWQVEAGNVGQHYYTWRYEQDNTIPEEPEPEPVYRMAYIQRINDETNFSRTLWTMNSDGTDQRSLGQATDLFANYASLSPDGQTIAFTSGSQLYTVGIDGSNLKAITKIEEGRQPFDVEWSPDGSRIAFTSLEIGESDQQYSYLYVISADGSSEVRLTDDGEWVWTATWSPDSTRLAIMTSRECESGAVCSIWTIKADGTEPELIRPPDGTNLADLDWSPDGTQIVYSTYGGDDQPNNRIMVMNADGSNDRQFIDSPNAVSPHWDLTGDRVYFADKEFGDYDIFVADKDGTNMERLTQDYGDEFIPAPPER